MEAVSEKYLLCPLKEQWPEGNHGCNDVIFLGCMFDLWLRLQEATDQCFSLSISLSVSLSHLPLSTENPLSTVGSGGQDFRHQS